jgi:carboxyl-terminal processing protease
LRGHLQSENGEEASGSSSYVPPEKEDDKQLQAAIDLLHGKTVTPTVQTVDQRATDGVTPAEETEAPARN